MSDDLDMRIDLEMPEALRCVHATIFARGAFMDAARGDPMLIQGARCADGRSLVAPTQVHGTALVEGRAIWTLPQRPKADIIHLDPSFDAEGRIAALIRTADCVPVLVASSVPHPWLIAAHSGFAGTTLGVMMAIARRVSSFYPECSMSDVHIWLGPAIGPCCYTRKADDPSTIRAMASWHEKNWSRDADAVRFDLHGEIASQAIDAGASEGNIHSSPLCTSCRNDILYSYRKGDTAARLALAAWLTA